MGRKKRSAKHYAMGLALSLLVAVAACELALHLVPSMIPAWYRTRFPGFGVEFFRPGVLDETPYDGLPLPLAATAWNDPPPADLIELGLVAPDVDVDRVLYPRVVTPIDARGLPNREALDSADVVFVGDSFLLSVACIDPPGFADHFTERTGLSNYNLGVAGLGPGREAWILEHVGLELEPELVIWFFFGGNDLVDARVFADETERFATFADKYPEKRPPRLFLPAIVSAWLQRREAPAHKDPLPPLEVPRPDGTHLSVWLHPRYLAILMLDRATWEAGPGWRLTREKLLASHERTRGAGARLAVVYLPSKAQVFLPLVRDQVERVFEMLTFQLDEPPPVGPAEFMQAALANRGVLEEMLRELCETDGIPYFSATPALEELARRGETGYLTCDTHWELRGQEAVLTPLLEFLRAEELLSR